MAGNLLRGPPWMLPGTQANWTPKGKVDSALSHMTPSCEATFYHACGQAQSKVHCASTVCALNVPPNCLWAHRRVHQGHPRENRSEANKNDKENTTKTK